MLVMIHQLIPEENRNGLRYPWRNPAEIHYFAIIVRGNPTSFHPS